MHSTPTFGFGFALMVEVLVMVSCAEFFPGPSEVGRLVITFTQLLGGSLQARVQKASNSLSWSEHHPITYQ